MAELAARLRIVGRAVVRLRALAAARRGRRVSVEQVDALRGVHRARVEIREHGVVADALRGHVGRSGGARLAEIWRRRRALGGVCGGVLLRRLLGRGGGALLEERVRDEVPHDAGQARLQRLCPAAYFVTMNAPLPLQSQTRALVPDRCRDERDPFAYISTVL